MAVEALVTPLLTVPLFHGLTPLRLAKIARASERIMFKPGEVIIRNGDEGNAAFVIVDGDAVRVHDGLVADDLLLPRSSLVGEMAMLVETEHSATVVTRSNVKALKITREALYDLMVDDPGLAEHFLTKIVGRLTDLANELRRIDATLATDGTDDPAGTAAPQRPEDQGPATQVYH